MKTPRTLRAPFRAVRCMALGIAGVLAASLGSTVSAIDAPHNSYDIGRPLTCQSCHYTAVSKPFWSTQPTTTDNTFFNNLCTSCHQAGKLSDSKYELIKTHSALNTGSPRWGGAWTVECRVCHSQHGQQQTMLYGKDSSSSVVTGTVSALSTGAAATISSITDLNRTFAADQYVGYLLIPNQASPTRIYRIRSNDAHTLVVDGALSTTAGKPYSIRYGKLLKTVVRYQSPGVLVNASVKFFGNSGESSFASGTSPSTSICMICHLQTNYFTNTGTLDVNGAKVHPAPPGVNCMTCHPHAKGFKATCENCHGEPPRDLASLATPTTGSDTWGKHERHVDDAGFTCTVCHKEYRMPDATNHAVDIGFDNFGSGGGVYRGQTTVNYIGRNGTDAGTNDGSRVCTNIACHSTGNLAVTAGQLPAAYGGNLYASPVWLNTAPATACNSCHGRSTANGMPDYTNGGAGLATANSHTRHVDGYGFVCARCHVQTVPSGFSPVDYSRGKHVNGYTEDIYFDSMNPSGSFAPGTGSKTCANLYCHGTASPQWGGSAPCGSCHAATAATILSGSHQTHLSSSVFRGPNGVSAIVTCDTCHGTGATSGTQTGHVNGSVTFADGNTLAATTVCDDCHSPGGDYDGVNDAVIGAKTNWVTGVYSGNDLVAGKEKWCAGCHDKTPSVVTALSVTAPNVVGDETGTFPYGTGWGFYKTGHGLPAGSTYPAGSGVTAGANRTCAACHDLSTAHIDGLARTFDDGDGTPDPSAYRIGYRLKKVAAGTGTGATTAEPLLVPWPLTKANSADNYRLCVTCHGSGPFTDATNTNTNMRSATTNLHQYHLVRDIRYPADWSGSNNSKITCLSCHNVHGSTRLAMVRDGKLTNREPGFRMWYYNADLVTYTQMSTTDPAPTNLGLAASTGSLYVGESASNLCSHCHAYGQTNLVSRTPYQSVGQAPVLSWTGEAGYASEGVDPDTGPGGSAFTFRVLYSDANNDAPTAIEVWIDRNDDGDFDDPEEKIALTAVNPGDANYTDGRQYTTTVALSKSGDGILPYRFSAEQSGSVAATGDPTSVHTVTVTNAVPVLSWTGEEFYSTGGVLPPVGGNNRTFEFRIRYTDADNEAPSVIQVLVDKNDDGDYQDAGEAIDMSKASGQDNDYRNGEIYEAAVAIPFSGDGTLAYRFLASDGIDPAVSQSGPVGTNSLTVLASSNTPPWLAWENNAPCLTEGVRPQTGPKDGDYEFRVRYFDWENTPPATIQVWVDKNGDDDFDDVGEQIALSLVGGGDGNYKNGEIYTSGTVTLPFAGEGDLEYTFRADDGTDAASGTPTTGEREVTVIDTAYKVRPSGGTGWYSTIASAVTVTTTGNRTILVYPDALFTSATYSNFTLSSKPGMTVRAVCGAGLTRISAGGAATQAVMIQNGANVVLDGFTVTGGTTYGVSLLAAPSALISNCTVSGNATGIGVNNSNPVAISGCLITNNTVRGVNAFSGASTTITDCEIAENGGGEVSGAGIYFNGGSHSVTGSVIRDNHATGSLASSGNGGGIFFMSTTGVTVVNTSITGNTAVKSGGGLYLNAAVANLDKCVLSGNSADSTGGLVSTLSTTLNVTNAIIAGNRAPKAGMAYINSTGAVLSFANDTFADNQATATTGGVFGVCNSGTLTVRNSIFWNNSAMGLGNNAYKECGSTNFLTVTDSDITTGPGHVDGGTITSGGNLDPAQDPLFMGNGDYHIRSGSPVIDKANASYAPADDIDGQLRPPGAADLGADEYVP